MCLDNQRTRPVPQEKSGPTNGLGKRTQKRSLVVGIGDVEFVYRAPQRTPFTRNIFLRNAPQTRNFVRGVRSVIVWKLALAEIRDHPDKSLLKLGIINNWKLIIHQPIAATPWIRIQGIADFLV